MKGLIFLAFALTISVGAFVIAAKAPNALTGFVYLYLAAGLIYWLGMIVLGTWVAEGNGHPAFAGALVGAVFGVFGIVFLCIAPPNRPVLWEREQRWREQQGLVPPRTPRA